MDPRERLNDPHEADRLMMDARLQGLWTAMPGIIIEFDNVNVQASVQITIQPQLRNAATGAWESVDISPLPTCPVVFPGGGGFSATFPLAPGDEVLVVFASRCIDAWWANGAAPNGGGRPQMELRLHDLSDGFCIPRVWSQPKKPVPVHATNAQLRLDDGTCFLEVTPAGAINGTAPAGFNLNGVTIDINGNLASPATITAVTDVIAQPGVSQVRLVEHKHGTGTAAAGTSPPTPGI